jgi:hypothetical protein
MAQALTADKLAQLVNLLAEGAYIHEATKAIGIARQRLHEYERGHPDDKQRIRAALAAGARFRIDEAAQKAEKATTRDQALIARIAMEVARSRAELVAPAEYGKQAQLPTLPAGSTATLTIRWAGDPAPDAQPSPQPNQITSREVRDVEHTPVPAPLGRVARAKPVRRAVLKATRAAIDDAEER